MNKILENVTRDSVIGRQQEEKPESAFIHAYIPEWAGEYAVPITKIGTVIIFYVVSCAYYCSVEKWDVRDAIYFVTVTISTVGYVPTETF